MNRELNFLKKNIENNISVVVACSGGPDSMCLLSLVNDLKSLKNINVICAHVNHKIRKESDEEARLVKQFCENKNIIFELLEINEYLTEKFSEEDARRKRYDFFKKTIRKYNAKYLLTAHHGDDLIETILMRLTRGSNLSGYVGIKAISTNEEYQILRPLLTTTKDKIIKYNQEKNIPYCIDASNEDTKYTRNRYRHNILPFLKGEDKNIHLKYLKFSQELIMYDNFVNEYIINKEIIVDNQIIINKILKESVFIQRKAIELLIKEIQRSDYLNISDAQMNEIMKIINRTNKRVDLNNHYKCINEYGFLKIIKEENVNFIEVVLDSDVSTKYFNFYYNTSNGNNSNYCIYLDSKEIKLPLKLRTKQNGDKMTVKNMSGTKKVSDIFIENKISKLKRDDYPILVDANNTILWLPGLKKSQFAKDKSEKYDIIIKCEAR